MIQVRQYCKEKKIAYIGRQVLGGHWLEMSGFKKNPVLANEIIGTMSEVQGARSAPVGHMIYRQQVIFSLVKAAVHAQTYFRYGMGFS